MNRLRLTFVFCVFLAASLRAAPLEEFQDTKYPIGANAALTVRNTDGTIYVYGSDLPELRVIMRKKAYSKARLDGISSKVAIEGDAVSIDTVYPPMPKGLSVADRSGTVDYIIMLPETGSVSQLELATGEVIVEGLRGPAVNARLTNGRMIARNCFSETKLSVGSGGLAILHDWWEGHPLSLEAEIGNGHIWCLLPSAAAVHLDATSGNGDIKNGFESVETRNHPKKLDVTRGSGARAEFKLRAANGNIEIEKID